MAASSQPVDNGPTYDLYFFQIESFKKYKNIKRLFLSLRDHPVEDVNFIRDDLAKYNVCPDAIAQTLVNPQFLFSKLRPLLEEYEAKFPGDKQLYDIVFEFENTVDVGRMFNLGTLAKLSPEVIKELYRYYGFRAAMDEVSLEIYRNSLRQLKKGKFDRATNIFTPSNLRERYLARQAVYVDYEKIMRNFSIEKIVITEFTVQNLRPYVKSACKLNRLDAIKKLAENYQDQRLFRPIVLSVIDWASWYGNLEILQYIKNIAGYSEKNPIRRIPTVSPTNVEIAEFLMTFVERQAVFKGALQQGLFAIYEKYGSLMNEDEDTKIEYAAESGNIRLVEAMLNQRLLGSTRNDDESKDEIKDESDDEDESKDDDESENEDEEVEVNESSRFSKDAFTRLFNKAIDSNCVDLFIYLYNTLLDGGELGDDFIFTKLLKVERPRILEYYYRSNPDLNLDQLVDLAGKVKEQKRNTIAKFMLIKNLKFLLTLMENDRLTNSEQYFTIKTLYDEFTPSRRQ